MATDSQQVGVFKTVEDSLREAVESLGLPANTEIPPYPPSKICSGRVIPASVNACNEGGHDFTNTTSSHHQGVNRGWIRKRQQRRYPKGIILNVISVSKEDLAKVVSHYTGQRCPQAMASATRLLLDTGDLKSGLPPPIIPNASSLNNPISPSTPHSLASTLTCDSVSLPATPIISINNASNFTSPITPCSEPNASISASLSLGQDFCFPSVICHGNRNHPGTVCITKSASEPCLDTSKVGITGDQFEDTSKVIAYYDNDVFSDDLFSEGHIILK